MEAEIDALGVSKKLDSSDSAIRLSCGRLAGLPVDGHREERSSGENNCTGEREEKRRALRAMITIYNSSSLGPAVDDLSLKKRCHFCAMRCWPFHSW